MKKYYVHSSRARHVISWVLSLLMIVAGAALIVSFFLAGRLDSTATNSHNPGGFNVPKLEPTDGENTSSTGPSDKTLWLTFWDLSNVVGGDKIYVTDANGTEYTYNVFKTFVVSPSNTQVTDIMPGKNILTL